MSCKHMQFFAAVKVARIEDVGRFVAEITVHCADCDTPFQFVGVAPGFNYDAPTVSLDGLDLSAPICPQGVQPTPLQGLQGYSVKGAN